MPENPLVRTSMRQMAETAKHLAELCERIDSGEPITEIVKQVFALASMEHADAVDQRIQDELGIRAMIEQAREARAYYDALVQRFKEAHDALKAMTCAEIEARPDIPYEGALGKLRIQKNPPALELDTGKEVTPDVVVAFAIEPQFVTTKITHYINTDRVKDELKSGGSLPWARIRQGVHCRFPVPAKKKELE